jgi:hypothetical protein
MPFFDYHQSSLGVPSQGSGHLSCSIRGPVIYDNRLKAWGIDLLTEGHEAIAEHLDRLESRNNDRNTNSFGCVILFAAFFRLSHSDLGFTPLFFRLPTRTSTGWNFVRGHEGLPTRLIKRALRPIKVPICDGFTVIGR